MTENELYTALAPFRAVPAARVPRSVLPAGCVDEEVDVAMFDARSSAWTCAEPYAPEEVGLPPTGNRPVKVQVL